MESSGCGAYTQRASGRGRGQLTPTASNRKDLPTRKEDLKSEDWAGRSNPPTTADCQRFEAKCTQNNEHKQFICETSRSRFFKVTQVRKGLCALPASALYTPRQISRSKLSRCCLTVRPFNYRSSNFFTYSD